MAKFNLRKHAQVEDPAMSRPIMEGAMESMYPDASIDSEEYPIGETGETDENYTPELLMKSDGDSDIETVSVPLFENHSQMYDKLKQMNSGDIKSSMDSAWNQYFSKHIGDTEIADDFKGALTQFFEADQDSEDAVDIANTLYDMYSKVHPAPEDSDMVDVTEDSELDMAQASTLDVIKLARNIAQSMKKISSGVFNLNKTAQHKGLSSSVILSGPGQTSLSPFTRDLQSSLHLVEQNKGFGIKIDNILDIDFEAIWRGNIMDKYTSPYRDAEGNYVGGYINRRFEVNRNIPVGNNLQLLPGTRSRPWMPEYSTIESRMQMSRGTKDDLVDPNTFAKISIGPFNLKKKSK